MSARFACLALLALGACAASGTGEEGDSGIRPRPDAGPAVDGGRADAGGRDGGGRDGAATQDGGARPDAGGSDAGPSPIVIDGVVSDTEWAGAQSASNGVASSWGAGLNELRRLRVRADGPELALAIEGALEAGAENAIVVYVDRGLGGPDGVADLTLLGDGTGALDNAISAGITTPSELRADFAWGTRDLGRAAMGFDDRMGWRDIATSPDDFGWVDSAVAPTVCSATACETRIPFATLGAAAAATVAVFARLTNTDGTDFANQCLPEDDPATPATVAMYLTLAR